MSFVTRNRAQALKRIRRWGRTGVLRRSSGDRDVLVLEDAFNTREIDGQRIQRTDRLFFMSPIDASGAEVVAPDAHEDSLILDDQIEDSNSVELIFASPPVRVQPGREVIYYELHCRTR